MYQIDAVRSILRHGCMRSQYVRAYLEEDALPKDFLGGLHELRHEIVVGLLLG